jgi:HNH endonuclease
MTTKAQPLPPLHETAKFYRLDPTSGDLLWRVDRGRAKAGTKAGGLSGNGYMLAYVNGKQYYVHRLVWQLFYGTDPGPQVDHIDNDPVNCSIYNLREATNSEQQLYRRTQPRRPHHYQRKLNPFRLGGFTWHRHTNSWDVRVGGKFVGRRVNLVDAIILRQIAGEALYGPSYRYTET